MSIYHIVITYKLYSATADRVNLSWEIPSVNDRCIVATMNKSILSIMIWSEVWLPKKKMMNSRDLTFEWIDHNLRIPAWQGSYGLIVSSELSSNWFYTGLIITLNANLSAHLDHYALSTWQQSDIKYKSFCFISIEINQGDLNLAIITKS